MMKDITVEYLTDALIYIDKMPVKARNKMLHNISLVQKGVMDIRIFKKISDSGIWEFRAEYQNNEYRLLAFWDKTRSSIVMATHGFDKKTRKTPRVEIALAEKIREEYYQSR